MKRLIILGATGSIGTTALVAIREKHLPIQVVGLSANSNVTKLTSLAEKFSLSHVALTRKQSTISDEESVLPPIPSDSDGLKWFQNIDDLLDATPCDIVLNAIAGFDGLAASIKTIERGIDLALANKESVVAGGSFLFQLAQKNSCKIIPVDSEHSAIHALLQAHGRENVESLIITASGGPFRLWDKEKFSTITVEDALNHPTWNMGKKITIDSATLANKALEVIEASYLFGFDSNHIEVTVHPQSIIHSMVRMKDGAVYAQLGVPDMTLPIIEGIIGNQKAPLLNPLSFANLDLHFENPDTDKFPMLRAAYAVIQKQGGYPIALNAANEVAVKAFIHHEISFTDITRLTLEVLKEDFSAPIHSFSDVLKADKKARTIISMMIKK